MAYFTIVFSHTFKRRESDGRIGEREV